MYIRDLLEWRGTERSQIDATNVVLQDVISRLLDGALKPMAKMEIHPDQNAGLQAIKSLVEAEQLLHMLKIRTRGFRQLDEVEIEKKTNKHK